VTVGYVGGKHLESVDADNYIFALFLMDTIACASEGYLWQRFQMFFTERLRAVFPNVIRLAAPYRRKISFSAPTGEPIAIFFKV